MMSHPPLQRVTAFEIVAPYTLRVSFPITANKPSILSPCCTGVSLARYAT